MLIGLTIEQTFHIPHHSSIVCDTSIGCHPSVACQFFFGHPSILIDASMACHLESPSDYVLSCVTLPFVSDHTMCLQVNVTLKRPGSKLEHQGIKIEFVGQIGRYLSTSFFYVKSCDRNGHNHGLQLCMNYFFSSHQ